MSHEVFRDVEAERARGTPSTTLVVFYSGHADAASLHLGGTELPLDELRQLATSAPASVKLLIIDACRTPIGRAHKEKGIYRDVRSDDLAASVVSALIERTGVDPAVVDDLVKNRQNKKHEAKAAS